MNAIAEPLHVDLQTANPSDRVALRGVHLRATIAGMSIKATVEQTFVNLEDRAIEALYTFPLPEGAAVCGFEVVFFDKVFTGIVDETDRAIEKYDEAISQGHGAYLLEQHRPDIFSVRVGNLKPRQAVTIRLTYITDLQIVDRSIRLSFPTTIAPRYATTSGTDPIDAAIDGDALNPPHVLTVPYGLSMAMEIDLGKSLASVTSPSHEIQVDKTSGDCKVTLVAAMAEMNRDLVLTLNITREQTPFALAATSDQGENFIAVTFLPEFDETDLTTQSKITTQTIFLLDCSGSMQGQSIMQATAALECCLRSMSAGDTFNICRFGSTFQLLASEPLVYSQQTLNSAINFVRQSADLGGTELLAPLEAIFAQTPGSSAVRNIVLLTDGQVTNEPAIIALAKRKRSRNRIFTFGIGTASSSFLVNGLARVTGGAAEFIAPGERIEEKVLRTFGRLASPPVTDLEIDWNNADVQIAPRRLPPLFDGDALRVFARLPGRVPQNVTLRCCTATGPKEWTVPVRQAADPARVLPSLWARAMIRTIEEENGVQSTANISGPSLDRANLVEISKRYNLLCGLTSFIAVEHRSLEDRNEGKPALRRVPVALAEGWGDVATGGSLYDSKCSPALSAGSGLLDLTRASDDTHYEALCDSSSPAARRRIAPPPPCSPAPVPPAKSRGLLARLRSAVGGSGPAKKDNKQSERLYLCDRADSKQPHASPPADHLLAQDKGVNFFDASGGDELFTILATQTADGSFESSPLEILAEQINFDRAAMLSAIDQLLQKANIPSENQPPIRQTLLVLLVLNLHFPDRKETWNRAYKKGIWFIHEKAKLPQGFPQSWLQELTTKFTSTPTPSPSNVAN